MKPTFTFGDITLGDNLKMDGKDGKLKLEIEAKQTGTDQQNAALAQLVKLAEPLNAAATAMHDSMTALLELTHNEAAQMSLFKEWVSTYKNTVNKADYNQRGPVPGLASIKGAREAAEHRSDFHTYVGDKMADMRKRGVGALLTKEGVWNAFATEQQEKALEAMNYESWTEFLRRATPVISALNERDRRKKSKVDEKSEPGALNGGKTREQKKIEAQQKSAKAKADRQAAEETAKAEEKASKASKKEAAEAKKAEKEKADAQEKAGKERTKSRKKQADAVAKEEQAAADVEKARADTAKKTAKKAEQTAAKEAKEDQRFAGMRAEQFKNKDGQYSSYKIKRELKKRNGGQEPTAGDVMDAQMYMNHQDEMEARARESIAPTPEKERKKQKATAAAAEQHTEQTEKSKVQSQKKQEHADKRGALAEVGAEKEKAAQAGREASSRQQAADAVKKQSQQEAKETQEQARQAKQDQQNVMTREERDMQWYKKFKGSKPEDFTSSQISDMANPGKVKNWLKRHGENPTDEEVRDATKYLTRRISGDLHGLDWSAAPVNTGGQIRVEPHQKYAGMQLGDFVTEKDGRQKFSMSKLAGALKERFGKAPDQKELNEARDYLLTQEKQRRLQEKQADQEKEAAEAKQEAAKQETETAKQQTRQTEEAAKAREEASKQEEKATEQQAE